MDLRGITRTLLLFAFCYRLAHLLRASEIVRFTNLKCETLDESFGNFTTCRLAVLKRHLIALNVVLKLYQLPLNNVSLNIQLLKKASGYRPFLYNMSVDFCDFMRNKRRNPFMEIVFNALEKDSNANHPCPYNHDIVVRNMTLTDDMFRLLPLPPGEYMFQIQIGTYNQWRAQIKAYLQKDR